jgi:hypothetical protein
MGPIAYRRHWTGIPDLFRFNVDNICKTGCGFQQQRQVIIAAAAIAFPTFFGNRPRKQGRMRSKPKTVGG